MASTTRPLIAPTSAAPIRWFLIGLAVAFFLQWTQATTLGGWSGLLAVGETATLRPLIEEALPGLVTVPGGGHDGQIGYAIALDLEGTEVPDLLVDAGYRYRRILLPALASVGGRADGASVLGLMILISATGMAMASAALEWLRHRFGWSPWVHLAVLANPGLWMAVRLLTPDALALGLAAVAVACHVAGRRGWVVVALVFAVLAKDQYLLVAFSLAAHQWFGRRDRVAVVTFGLPAGVLVLWAASLQARMGGGLSPRGNLTWPGGWIASSLPSWQVSSLGDDLLVLAGAAALVGGIGILIFGRSPLLRWLVAPWVLMALVSSEWVWGVGNNVVRVFAPLIGLVIGAAFAAGAPRTRRAAG